MTGSYHLRGRYFWIFVCLLLVLVITPEPQQSLPRAEAATFIVDTLDDVVDATDGILSLREAIAAANGAPGPDTINFTVTGTIMLTTGQLGVTDHLTINGPGGSSITLDGNDSTRIMNVGSGVIVTLNDLTFQNGWVPGGTSGGAIWNDGTLTINNSTFSGNSSAANGGGAIVNVNLGTLDIDNSTFSGNTAGFGGAIAGGGTLMTINNSTFSGNTATGSGSDGGGAIFNFGGTLTITSSTFSGNSATNGGTLYRFGGTVNVASSLIVGGSCSGITDLGNNLSFNAAGCPGTTTTDPQLGPLQNNGGPTDTMLPSTDGPAVDAYAAPCATSTDQRGVPRPQGPSCDIGATEQDGSVMLAVSAVCNGPNLDVIITAGDGSFDITASAGQNTPVNGVSTGTTTINGPEKWDDLTVTETMGDFETINLGKFKCRTDERPTPLTPAHRSRTTNPFPLFSWTPISIANNYRIFIFDNKVAADRTVDIRRNSFGATSITLGFQLPDGRLFWRVRGRQNRVWSLWSVRFTLFKDPTVPLTINETTPVPTINLNPPSDDNSAPNPAPTLPPPPNSR